MAQPDFDNTELIEKLSRRGMDSLLDRLIEVDPPEDAVDRLQLDIARARLKLRQLEGQLREAAGSGDNARVQETSEEVGEAFASLIEAQRQLADDPALADRRERLIWKTDLAETLLFDRLRGRENYAGLFVEFGVPTAVQADAVADAATEALRLGVEAEQLLFDLQRFYGQDADARQADQASQLYFRLIEDYGQQRTPFVAATAMHLVALLPNDAPYFAAPDRDGAAGLPGQRDSLEEERLRLLRAAADRLDTLYAGDPGPAEDAVRSRLGRVLTALGQSDEALDQHLDPMLKAGADGLPGLTAGLGRAAALRQVQRFPTALESLDDLQRNELVDTNPLLRLLLTDARYLALRGRAPNDRGRAAAYDSYFEMLREPEVRDAAPVLRSLIYRRWAEELEVGQDVSGYPPAVRMAIGQTAREAGQRAKLVDADDAEAEHQLRWSIRVNRTLAEEDLPDAVRASGLFNGALAEVLLNPGDVATLVGAVDSWAEVAERYPREPMAEEAITYAADYATALIQQAPDHPAVGPLYERTMNVLFTRYDEIDTAGKHRLFFAYRVFQQQGQHERAAQEYARVPFDHEQYFEAQALRLFNLQKAYEQTPADATDPQSGRKLRDARRNIAVGVADQVLDEADDAVGRGGGEAVGRAQRAVGAALLTLAAADSDKGDYDAALQRLDAIEQRFADDSAYDDVRRDAAARRIVTLVSAGRYNDASTEAQAMMSRFPDAAAGVIGDVLRDLEAEIAALREEAAGGASSVATELTDRAGTLASVASTLANLLVAWADDRDLAPEAMLAYELPYVRALKIAGRPADAWQFLKDRGLLDRFPDDLGVLDAAGETLYALGVEEQRSNGRTTYRLRDEGQARAAIPHFDRIIRGLQPPYPEAYWNAWLRRLSLNVALRLDLPKVPLRIRQLQASHPDLGGPGFKKRFERLAVDARSAQ